MTPKLKIISEIGKGKIFTLDSEKSSIGRVAENEIVLKNSSISRRHCILEKRGESFFISDADSLNGTFVNGLPANQTPLTNGDEIAVGDFTLRFLTTDADETSSNVKFDQTEFRLPKDSVKIRLEEVFGAMARDLSAILQIITKINTIRDVNVLQIELLRQVFEVVPAAQGAILLTDGAGDFVETVGFDRTDETASVRVSQTVINEVFSEQKVLLVKDFSADSNTQTAESLFISDISTLLCVPLQLFSKPLGVIYLTGSKTNFDESHLRFLTAMAGIAAVAIENARSFTYLENENDRLRSETFNRHILGESGSMQKVFETIRKVAPTEATVLIEGESGTGKELAAQAVHLNSRRREKPFVAVNCAVLTENLLESELFGHEKGAFTGAVAQKKGKIEMAEGGTLFLDEIGELNINLQAKLLRVLQERAFERVGGTRPIKTDIRLIAATNRELTAEIRQGNFRQDLYYRLNVVRFALPPLRERREDIPLLTEYFIQKFVLKIGRRIRGITKGAQNLLNGYDFPGNVRELENAVERAVVLGSDEWIRPEDLPEDLLEKSFDETAGENSNYHDAVREKKKALIIKAFRESGGSYVETAKQLGVHPNYLHRLIRNLELKEELEG